MPTRTFAIVSLFALAAAGAGASENLHPIEGQLRHQFPSVALHAHAELQGAQEFVAGQTLSGLRARQRADARDSRALRVFYPASYDEPFVVDLGEQRVVLRAVGARFAKAEQAAGKIFYPGLNRSTDAVILPSSGRSEELLVLHDPDAPRTFEYEIVEMKGVAGVTLQDGAIRFVPDRAEPVPALTQIANGRFVSPTPSIEIERPWVVDAEGHRSETAASWTILEDHGRPRAVRLTVTADPLAYPIVIDPTFTATGSMTSARQDSTATLLPNGKVLVAGGFDGVDYLNTAEIYDPATGTFTATTGTMNSPRVYHSATLMPNGKVLIAGGNSGIAYVNTAEVFDPATGVFTATSSPMITVRGRHTATLLLDGRVLIAGGENEAAFENHAEIYSGGTFTATSNVMTARRSKHTATLLPSGKVLIAGGQTDPGVSNTAELFDPGASANGTFSAVTPTMSSAREFHTATLLANGQVLIAGGVDGVNYLNTVDLYDPSGGPTGSFSATSGSMGSARAAHAATLLRNGSVLITGGYSPSSYTNTAELYEPGLGSFQPVGVLMVSARGFHTSTLLPNGSVLIAGGVIAGTTVEFYSEDFTSFINNLPMSQHRYGHTATLLSNGKVLIAGGVDSATYNSAEIYDYSTNAIVPNAAHMVSPRYQHTATLLPDGKVLIAGGFNSSALNTAELYDSTTGSFAATAGPMTDARGAHTATLLRDGRVLIVGGTGQVVFSMSTAEIYQPATGTFKATTGSMNAGRSFAAATLLPNGKVLITGGLDNSGNALLTAELFDPDTGTFTLTAGTMSPPRAYHTSTLLPNGTVLIAGGYTSNVSTPVTNTAQIFNPATGSFTTTTVPMTSARYQHTATLMADGRVLIAGGLITNATNAADIYDPASGKFSATVFPMGTGRCQHTATLLPNNDYVYVTGGRNNSGSFNSTELFVYGDLYTNNPINPRPVLVSLTNPLCQPANLAASGSFFTGSVSEGSTGSTQNSASNAPLLRLQRVDNDEYRYAPFQNFSAASLFSAPLSKLASGAYRVAIVSSAFSSEHRVIDVETTPLLGTYPAANVNASSSTTVAPTSLPAGYDGTFYPQRVSVTAGFTGTVRLSAATGAVTVTNAGPIGDYTVTVASTNACGSPSTPFALHVLGPPTSMTATGGTPQSALTSTAFLAPLQVTVTDSAGHPLNNVAINFSAPLSGASATLSNGGAASTNASGVASVTATANGVLGSYNVTATLGALTATFSLENSPVAAPASVAATATSTTSVSVTWLATAGVTYEVQRVAPGSVTTTLGTSTTGVFPDNTAAEATAYLYSVRAIAPSTSAYSPPDLATTVIFTDPTLVANTTPVKPEHITELRTAVDAVRTLAAKGGGSYTDSIVSNVTPIRSVHVTDLRAALDDARDALFLSQVNYSKPGPSLTGLVISRADINELRGGVQ